MPDHIELELRRWMVDQVLPFWAERGFDPSSGLFCERLLADGTVDRAAPLRVRVQFRQIYCYSHAAVLGWFPHGASLALKAWEATLARFWDKDEGGFLHILASDGRVIDGRRDSYDHAFAILALAWLSRATGDLQVRAMLDRVLAFVDERMSDSDGGLLEGVPHALPRRQNPQMHWFEAMLALKDAIAHPEADARAARHRALFQLHLYDAKSQTLGEYFAQDWGRIEGDAGDSVEPGHQAEWTWLLRSHERLTGLAPDPVASALLETAIAAGDPASGLLVDEVDRKLRVRKGTRRSWLQTELCKAWLAEAETGRPGAQEAARAALANLDRHYLRKPFAAGWIDQLDEVARPIPGPVPASTLYHILVAIIEADRVLNA